MVPEDILTNIDTQMWMSNEQAYTQDNVLETNFQSCTQLSLYLMILYQFSNVKEQIII